MTCSFVLIYCLISFHIILYFLIMELDLCVLVSILAAPFVIIWVAVNAKKRINKKSVKKWGFFHPFCNDGGGGEKVLWCIIKALAQETRDQIVVYSLEPEKTVILEKVSSRFGISIDSKRFEIIHVQGRWLLTSKKFLTMVFHIILPIIYTFKCLWKYQPDILYDTTGYASALLAAKFILPFTTTAAYVHYPFISQEMLQKVREQRSDFNNSQTISKSPFLSKAKLYYYYFVFIIYKFIGKFVDFAQANSSWTHEHMKKIWPNLDKAGKLTKLYPPCTVDQLLKLKKPDPTNTIHIMSLAQFRPEKQQHLQLQVIAQLLKCNLSRKITLRICGTTRGADDEAILANLKAQAANLGIDDYVQFVVNQPFSKIEQCMQKCWMGFHTMEAEHFGISIVEMLAAGLLVVAHNSAGPKFDIIRQSRYLADKKEDYADKIRAIVQATNDQLKQLSQQSRIKSKSFGQESFKAKFLQSIAHVKSA